MWKTEGIASSHGEIDLAVDIESAIRVGLRYNNRRTCESKICFFQELTAIKRHVSLIGDASSTGDLLFYGHLLRRNSITIQGPLQY